MWGLFSLRMIGWYFRIFKLKPRFQISSLANRCVCYIFIFIYTDITMFSVIIFYVLIVLLNFTSVIRIFLSNFSLSYCFSVRVLHFQDTLLRVSIGNLRLFFMLDRKVCWLAVLRVRHSVRTFIVSSPVITSLQTRIRVNCIDPYLGSSYTARCFSRILYYGK